MSICLPSLGASLRVGVTLALILALAACSDPPRGGTPGHDPVTAYPYVPGQDDSWTDAPAGGAPSPGHLGTPWHGLAVSPQGEPVPLDLTDQAWTSAASGYGPVEVDRSNHTRAGGDGQTLSVGGVRFARGLGTHANSDVRYTLPGPCTTFTASVGVDDEVGDRGSVVFQVWNGTATKLYDSGVMRGQDPVRSVGVNLSGVRDLRLVVTDAGDGLSFDHADWAAPRVTCTAPAPSGETFLSDLTPSVTPTNGYGPFERDRSNGERAAGDGRVLSVGGLTFARGLGVHAASSLSYDLNGTCTTFTASLGVDDEVGDRGSVVFQVSADGVRLHDSGRLTGLDPARGVRLDVTGRRRLTLTVTDAGDGPGHDHADWAGARVQCAVSTLPPGGLLIDFRPAASPPPAGSVGDTGAAFDPARGFGWIREDSVGTGPPVPLDLTPNLRDRAVAGIDARLNTFAHMQFPAHVSNPTAVRTPAAWEYALPNGVYTVTVAVGDAGDTYDSAHQINVEGQLAVARSTPVPSRKFVTSTVRVTVGDGRLTVDARGGTNTKLGYLTIEPGSRPSARVVSPQDAETLVPTTASVTADVNLPHSAIDLTTLTPTAARLLDPSGAPVPAVLNTSGGGDVIVLKPSAPLAPHTRYTFELTDGVRDTSGVPFLPRRSTFVTGPLVAPGPLTFEQVALATVPVKPYTAVEMGPDGKLYAATLTGELLRFGVQPDGTLDTPQLITSVQAANHGPRTIIGLTFDPAATADNPVVWISNNHFWDGTANAPDWSGKLTRLSGPNLETVQDYVVGLPRSIRDHETNSLAFRPGEPGALYVLQGSNTAMGAPDTAWGGRPERLLSGALLKLDLTKLSPGSLPLNVKTEEGGTYDPAAPGAPLTIYASGIRNAYDLVWHTNGQLYVPTNGSAAGGNTPATPTPLPGACQTRGDGPYAGPVVPALRNVGVQHDYLFRITPGGYYGHPNPLRCEWVLNGGNPTAGADRAQVGEYPVGTLPDRNWQGYAYDFGEHVSPNGVIEEYTSAPTSALRNKLLVVRYSAGKDIIVLTPGANGDIASAQTLVTGLTNFNPSPLDLTEDRRNGHLYVAQLNEQTGTGKITLVRLR